MWSNNNTSKTKLALRGRQSGYPDRVWKLTTPTGSTLRTLLSMNYCQDTSFIHRPKPLATDACHETSSFCWSNHPCFPWSMIAGWSISSEGKVTFSREERDCVELPRPYRFILNSLNLWETAGLSIQRGRGETFVAHLAPHAYCWITWLDGMGMVDFLSRTCRSFLCLYMSNSGWVH